MVTDGDLRELVMTNMMDGTARRQLLEFADKLQAQQQAIEKIAHDWMAGKTSAHQSITNLTELVHGRQA